MYEVKIKGKKQFVQETEGNRLDPAYACNKRVRLWQIKEVAVLKGSRSVDRFRLIRRGRTELESRRPTEGAKVNDRDKRDFETEVLLRLPK